jgi:lactate dehydrogenase-like 2-hydroxyacid dehydrogenase
VRLPFSLFDERAVFRPLTVEPVNSKFLGRNITLLSCLDHTNIGQVCTFIGYILQDERNRPDQRLQNESASSRFRRNLPNWNVVIAGHQAFLTKEALEHIAQTTIDNIVEFEATRMCRNQVRT